MLKFEFVNTAKNRWWWFQSVPVPYVDDDDKKAQFMDTILINNEAEKSP